MKRLGMVLLGAALLAGVSVPALASQGHQQSGTSSASCNDGTVSASPAIIWPPNHKLIPITVSYTDNDSSGDQVSITGITETMVDGSGAANVEGRGVGQPASQQGPDYVDSNTYPSAAATDPGSSSVTVEVRSERAGTVGNGSGRVYSLTVSCKDQGGADPKDTSETVGQNGMGTVHVCVPHDMSDASLAFCKNAISGS